MAFPGAIVAIAKYKAVCYACIWQGPERYNPATAHADGFRHREEHEKTEEKNNPGG